MAFIKQIEWKITKISDVKLVWQNSTPKVDIVVEEETSKEYKDSIWIQFMWDKTELLNWYKVGDIITVFVNFRCKQFGDRDFTNISGWKIEWSKSENEVVDNSWDMPF